MTLSFFVPGKPVPKGRPRMTRSGHVYTPKRTQDWEQTVAWHAKAAMRGKPMLAGSLEARLTFYGAHGLADADNLAKACLDGIQGVCFANDRQVTRVTAEKATGQPGVRIELEEVA